MKAVILAGGLGSRLSEETSIKPKPMVEIGGRPILWHIMKIYSYHGINDFIVCLGYKGYVIKEYFLNYAMHMSDLTVDLSSNDVLLHRKRAEPWKITLVDTGDASMTGGRLLNVRQHLVDQRTFCFTYGDGVSDVNVSDTIKFHRNHGKLATMTCAIPPARFGSVEAKNGVVSKFVEKPKSEMAYVNAGFFVLNSEVFDYIEDDISVWENEPLQNLVADKQLMSYNHDGFWQPMDTLRDKNILEQLWSNGRAPWRVWSPSES